MHAPLSGAGILRQSAVNAFPGKEALVGPPCCGKRFSAARTSPQRKTRMGHNDSGHPNQSNDETRDTCMHRAHEARTDQQHTRKIAQGQSDQDVPAPSILFPLIPVRLGHPNSIVQAADEHHTTGSVVPRTRTGCASERRRLVLIQRLGRCSPRRGSRAAVLGASAQLAPVRVLVIHAAVCAARIDRVELNRHT